jgi:hypothetical protein
MRGEIIEVKTSNNKIIKIRTQVKPITVETEYEKEYKKERALSESKKRKKFLKKHNQEKLTNFGDKYKKIEPDKNDKDKKSSNILSPKEKRNKKIFIKK